MITMFFRFIIFGCIALLLSACTQTPKLVENTTIAYFDERGNNITKPSPTGSYRQLLKIQSNGYLVQSFFVDTKTKQTDPFIIHNREDLTAIDPLSIDGFFVQWYRNGQKAGSGYFIKGKRQGTFTEWTEKGVKWMEMHFENDLVNGKANLWYEDGSKYIEGQYLAGKEEGEWKIWQQNGPIRFKATFEQGKVISAEDANGKPVNLTKDDFTAQ